MNINEMNPFNKSNQGAYEIIKYIRNNTEHPYKNNFLKKQLPTYIKIEQVVKKFKFNSSNELIKFLQPEI